MSLTGLLRRRETTTRPGVTGCARMDRHTSGVLGRLRPGDIAVIDHVDLDRISAEALVRSGVVAVVNAAPSTSGRYPNLGPELLVSAGIPLVDDVGPEVFAAIRDGDRIRVDGDGLYVGDALVARGLAQDLSSVHAALAAARSGLHAQLEAFAANTTEYLLRDQDLLLDGVGIPDIRTDIADRQVVVVVQGYEYEADLVRLRPYLRQVRPVLVGVEGGADALLAAGYTPALVVGRSDAISEDAARCGAEIVVHTRPGDRSEQLARVQDLGVVATVFETAGTSEDAALLLAETKGAALIVAVGTHATLIEFLDRGRRGVASTFLTRLRVGGTLVDASAVSQLYRRRTPRWSLALLAATTGTVTVAAVDVAVRRPGLVGLRGVGIGSAWHRSLHWVTAIHWTAAMHSVTSLF